MKAYQNFVANRSLRRMVVLLFCIVLIWFMRSIMSTVLLTFIFTFLSISLIRWVQKYLKWSPFWIITPIYLIIVGLVYLVATHYIPSIVDSTVILGKKVFHFYNSSQVQHNPNISVLVDWLKTLKLDEQLKTGVTQIVHYVTSIGAMGVTLVISFLLSYFYSFEADRMNAFGRMFKNGRFSWFFEDVQYFAQTFVNTFGVVLEAQLIIAFINTILTSIVLIALKIPSVPSLAIMIFLLSLIPVAGVIVSLVPLSIVAYTVGGFRVMVYIWIAIALIHCLETYVLNPKLMSSRTHLPIFVTFIILLISEKLLGTWGLIVGIPIFTFFLDIMGIRQGKVKK
ncbi:AI-2E family transporter [Bombilactobacillus thymidiniphilus]|uniref:AI-2E family transporter n=1 Tax=Bombilactobacillus thymidiniphilus TaxID=2923363 RepID=A0ABY4PC76_9LACO|nr:AI-2E family transporter [Bombilactobacillus thymidiniphilus]UQS83146.1 AI-2E family transporter [Bombilactobacillus thymidiniphilus]